MSVPNDIAAVLSTLGVGRRFCNDPFFESNKTLDEMKERIEVYETDTADTLTAEAIKCNVPGCLLDFKSLSSCEAHYNSAHRYTCCNCRKILPTAHLLDLHVAENHDSFFAALAERRPSYACFLETCMIKLSSPKERKDHCLNEHKFPPNFRFDYSNKKDAKKSNVSQSSTNSSEKSFNNDVNKPKTFNFNFSHSKQRFKDSRYTGKKFINESKPKKDANTKTVDYEEMVVDLKESLPE